jgi:uncharacterized SAM-binding protein YcdF (DUF218 family)
MMDLLNGFVKAALVPGSVPFLLIGLAVGVALLHRPMRAHWGRRWLTALLIGYVALSLPAVSTALEEGLHPPYAALASAAEARGATAIVVLGNGAVTYGTPGLALDMMTRRTAFNVLEGARLYRLLNAPVFVSGGIPDGGVNRRSEADIMRDAFVALGVPADRLVLETRSGNTQEQAANLAPLLASHQRFVLVTTPLHLRRTLTLFEAKGLRPVPSPSAITYREPDTGRWGLFVPDRNALRGSELIMYEYLALAYGRSRGWLGARDTPQ